MTCYSCNRIKIKAHWRDSLTILNLQQQLQGHAHIVKLVCAASQLSETHDKSTNSFDEYLLLMELCSG